MPDAPTAFQALRHFRWIQTYDIAMLVIVLAGAVASCWSLRVHSFSVGVFSFLLVMTASQLWLVSLLFRCSWFVLLLISRCKLLPSRTADYAVAFREKRADMLEDSDDLPKFTKGHFSALRDVGWVKPYDYVTVAWVLVCLVAAGQLLYEGSYWATVLMAMAFIATTMWCITLSFRCSWFVLQLSADIRTVPREAMRMIVLRDRQA